MKKLMPALLLALGAAALLVAGCEADWDDGYYHDGHYHHGHAHLEVDNETDATQFIYVDGDLVGSVDPGETVAWEVEEGWHHLDASESDTGPVDPLEAEGWFDDDETFHWTLAMPILPLSAGSSGSSGEEGAADPVPELF